MNDIRARLTAALACAVLVGGCVKQQATLPPPARPNPPPQVAADPMVRVQTLSRLAEGYSQTSNELPGNSPLEHRRLMANVFAQLEEILPILEGPNPGAEFRQQLQVVRDAQAELATGPQELSPEPTIDTGLRAVRDALSSIAQASYYDQSALTPLFDQFSSKINDLDTVRGPLHQVVAGEAVGLSSQIVTSMADTLTRRLAEQSPTTAPTTEAAGAPGAPTGPSAATTTQPATAPSASQ
jgi:hypothetical protein